MSYLVRIKEKLTSFQIITLGFVGVILLGAMLLMLPIYRKVERLLPLETHYLQPHLQFVLQD